MMRSLTPVLSIVISVLLFFFFVQPQYAKIQDLENEVLEYTDGIEQYKKFTATLEEKLKLKNSRTVEEGRRLDLLLSDTLDDSKRIVDLETLAKKHRLLFGNVTTNIGDVTFTSKGEGNSSTAPSDELLTADVSFEVIGTYAQFKSFLQDLGNSITLFEVVEITFTPNVGEFHQFKLTVRTYALPDTE